MSRAKQAVKLLVINFSAMIKIIGTLKGVQLKSKVGDDDRSYHNVQLSLEITDGVDRIQEIVESLKQIVSVSIENKQPKLPVGEPKKPYNDK